MTERASFSDGDPWLIRSTIEGSFNLAHDVAISAPDIQPEINCIGTS